MEKLNSFISTTYLRLSSDYGIANTINITLRTSTRIKEMEILIELLISLILEKWQNISVFLNWQYLNQKPLLIYSSTKNTFKFPPSTKNK